MRRVKARMDEVAGASNQGVTTWLEGMDNVDLIRGHAKFVDDHSVEVSGEVLEAEKIFINVGARPRIPDWEGLKNVPFFTSSTIMNVDFLPERLIIVGGSYIGLEFAQIYRRFGSEFGFKRLLDLFAVREDPHIRGELVGTGRDRGEGG